MSLVQTKKELYATYDKYTRKGKTLGFVPTMGALHSGHLSLIKKAKAENDLVVVSIFVNPTQFAPNEDFEQYPRDIQRDYALAKEAGADIVYHPSADEIYIPNSSTAVEVTGDVTSILEAATRPTHFSGVTRVVTILFNIIQADNAYFGQKDAQQAIIIQKMVRDLHMPIQIHVCPIIREEDGLAMSSRNIYLTPAQRKQATILSISLQKAKQAFNNGERTVATLRQLIIDEITTAPLATIDYVEIKDAYDLHTIETIDKRAIIVMTVYFGKTRLLDNLILE